MPQRFYGNKDLATFEKFNRELLGEPNIDDCGIIDQFVILYRTSVYDTETNKEIGSLQFRTYLTEYGGGNDTYLIFDSIYYFSNIVQETKELGSGTMNAKYSDKLQDAELKLKTTGIQIDAFGFQGSLRYLGKECLVSLKNDNQGKIFYNFKFN